MGYCSHCGNPIYEDDDVCEYCGRQIYRENGSETYYKNIGREQLITRQRGNPYVAGKIFMLISVIICALGSILTMILCISLSTLFTNQEFLYGETIEGFETITLLGANIKFIFIIAGIGALIPLCWYIPMTVYVFRCSREYEEIGVVFKICVLLFVNVIAGILLLCDNFKE